MRTEVIARSLAELGTVDLLVLPLDGRIEEPPPGSGYARVLTVPQRYSPLDHGRNPVRSLVEFALGTLRAQVRMTRAAVREEAPAWLAAVHYDVVWYMREHIWLMTRGLVRAPSVIDVDDLRDLLLRRWREIGKADRGAELTPLRRLDMSRVIARWEGVHRQAARGADVLVYSSGLDLGRSGYPNSVVVPNTYAAKDARAEGDADGKRDDAGDSERPPTILFQGILAYAPNADAATRLVEDIAPLVREKFPDLRVLLAGQSSPRIDALARHPGVEVTGTVPSMTPHLKGSDVLVAPLRVAGGTRIKILEAFAHRLPVVSTPVGAEGLDAVAGVHLELGETAEELAEKCVRLLVDRGAAKAMADRAHTLYRSRYLPEHAARRVRRAVERAIGR